MRACWNPQILPRWTPTGYRGRAIARLIFNTAHGRSINEKHSEMSVEWRGCHRTMWTRADPGPLRADGREISAEDMEAIKDVQDMRDATGMEDKSQAQTEKECAKQRTYVQLLSNCLQAAQRVCAGDLSTLANNLPANVLSARGCAPVQRGTTSEQVDFLLTALKTPVQTDAAGAPAAAAPAGASPATASAAATNDGASEVKTRADPFGAFATVTAADYEELAQQWKSTPWPRCPPPLNMEQRSAMRPVLEYLIQYTKWTRQSRAMRAVDPAAALPPRPQAPLVLVHAEPGAGKSLMLTALCKWVEEHSEGLLRTSCCAMTGSAATLIPDGKTVFTLLGIPARVKKEDDGSLICPLAQGIKTATKMALSQLCNPLLGDGWTAGALACDEVSQFTPDMLADVDCRMKEGTCDEYKHLDFGGHCVVLFGDFFQKMPTHGKSLPKAMIEYFVEEMRGAAKSDFEKKYRVDSARARGVHLFRKFKLVTLPQQMRSQGDVEHIEMIRRWRDIHTTDPQLLSKEYLASLQVYCSKDWLADGQWRHAPVAVVGNLERRVLTPVLLQTFAHDAQQPVLKWRLKRIVSATKGSITSKEKRSMRQARSKAALATMKDEDLSQLYAYEPGMWGRLVPGADAVVLDNVAVAKKVANGSPCKMLALGYYDDNTGRQVATLAAGGKAGEELEVPEPDYVVVEFTGADAVDTYKDSTLMVGRAIVAFPQSTFVPTDPQLLSKEYLASLQVYCSKDWLADGQWRHAPVAVVGNLERRVLTPVLLQTFAHDAQQPVLKWRLKRIVSATKGSITSKEKRSMRQARSKAALATMKDEDLSQLYAYEPGMWGRLVPGADAVVLDNVAVAKKVANGSPCKMLALGYYDDNTGRQVATLAAGGKAGEELEVPEPDYVVVEFTGADAVDTYKDSTLMVGRAIVAFPQSTFVPTEIPTRSEFAAERGVWSVPMKSPPVELALIRTDYKEQGRSEPRLVLSLMSSGVMPHLDAFGLYVLLTRATRGRESIRLLLPENAKPEVALQHLLGSNFQRDPHLVSHLRGYDVDGNWDVELASTAWKMVGTDSSGGKRKRAAPSGGSKGATGSAAGQPSKARKAPATKDPSLAHMFMQKRLPPPRPCPPANPSIQVCYPRSLPARVCCTDCMLNCHRFEASLEDRA